MNKKLHRSQTDKIFAGVCGGLADYFDIDATIIRLLFILIVAFGGSGLIVYLLLWLIMPKSSNEPAIITEEKVKEVAQEIKERAEEFRENIKKDDSQSRAHNHSRDLNRRRGGLFGWVLLVLGLVFLFNSFAPTWMRVHFFSYWPLILVFLGLIMIVNSNKK
jgi:phage shock protein PspC (stress-responsive transcriptional regulator)